MKYYLKVITLFMFSCGIISCKREFLDIVPKKQQIAITVADYDLMTNSNNFYHYNYTGTWLIPVLMGDDVAAEQSIFRGTSSQMQNSFNWKADIFTSTDEFSDLGKYMQDLYSCNKVINEVMEATDGSDAQKRTVRAKAMVTRAWLYFQIINLYGKPYNEITSAQDPGFPIITLADVNQSKFVRTPVKDVYNFIIKDLSEAIPDLPLDVAVATQVSRSAAQGLLGKVFLFMGKPSDALPFLNDALSSLSPSNGPHLYDYNVELAPGGSFLPMGFYGPDYPGNNYDDLTESVLAKTFSNGLSNGGVLGTDGLIMSPETMALYGSDDLRLLLFSTTNSDQSTNVGGRLRKYVQSSKFGLELSELYLLSAECKARTNNLIGAKADVETLRKKRMPATSAIVPAPIASNKDALIKFIIDERTREFAAEGYRWFDMRRLSVDPIFKDQVYKHFVYDGTSSVPVQTITLDKVNRFVLRFQQNIMNSNPDFGNNP